MAVIGQLIFEMSANVARLQQDMGKARSTVDSTMNGIKSAAKTAMTALGAIGLAVAGKELVDFVTGAIEAQNALYELSIRTGQTVESLSALKPIAKESGTDMDTVAMTMGHLAKSMLEAQSGTGQAGAMFKALGINILDANGHLRDAGDVLPELAGKLSSMSNRTEEVAAALVLLSRSGAQQLPFLHALAEAGTLQATTTTEQAKRAHELAQKWVEVQQGGEILKNQMATGLTPVLLDTVQAFLDLRGKGTDAQGFFETIGTVIRYTATAAGSFWLAIKDMGQGIGALAAEGAALLHGDLAGIKAIRAAREEESKKNEEEYEAFVKRMLQTDAIVAKVQKTQRTFNPKLPSAGGGNDEALKAEQQRAKDTETMWKQVYQSIDDEQTRAIEDGKALLDGQTKKTKEANDWARQVGLTFQSAFENASAKGKSFRDVLNGIAQDIARIMLRQTVTEPAGNAISAWAKSIDWGAIFGASGGGARAGGGPVSAGAPYVVGERGPELFVPSGSGDIVPSGALGGGGDIHLHFVNPMDGPSIMRLMPMIMAGVRQAYNQRGAVTPIG